MSTYNLLTTVSQYFAHKNRGTEEPSALNLKKHYDAQGLHEGLNIRSKIRLVGHLAIAGMIKGLYQSNLNPLTPSRVSTSTLSSKIMTIAFLTNAIAFVYTGFKHCHHEALAHYHEKRAIDINHQLTMLSGPIE